MAKPFLDGHRVYARDGSVKEVRGPDHCVYRPDGSRIPGMRWIEQTAAKWIRSEQIPRWQKPAALKDPTSLLDRLTHRFYTRFLHGRVAEPKDTGAFDNDYPSLSLSVSGGGIRSC